MYEFYVTNSSQVLKATNSNKSLANSNKKVGGLNTSTRPVADDVSTSGQAKEPPRERSAELHDFSDDDVDDMSLPPTRVRF